MDKLFDLIFDNIGLFLIIGFFFANFSKQKEKSKQRKEQMNQEPKAKKSRYEDQLFDMNTEEDSRKSKPWDVQTKKVSTEKEPNLWEEFLKALNEDDDDKKEIDLPYLEESTYAKEIPVSVIEEKKVSQPYAQSSYQSEEGQSMMRPDLAMNYQSVNFKTNSRTESPVTMVPQNNSEYERVEIPTIRRDNLRQAIIFAEIISKPKAYKKFYRYRNE